MSPYCYLLQRPLHTRIIYFVYSAPTLSLFPYCIWLQFSYLFLCVLITIFIVWSGYTIVDVVENHQKNNSFQLERTFVSDRLWNMNLCYNMYVIRVTTSIIYYTLHSFFISSPICTLYPYQISFFFSFLFHRHVCAYNYTAI